MPACSNAIHPSGIKISFTEDDHKYSSFINNKEIVYTSSTTFIHHFFPKFDPNGDILRYKAAKLGITPEKLKSEWDKNRDASCLFGTRTHSLCEDILLNRPCRVHAENEKEKLVFENGRKVAEKFKTTLDILDVEKIIFNPFLPRPIAGTIDLLARSRKDGSILILDWKTSKTIDQENKYNKFGLDPIKHVPDLNWYHYSLQTSLYQYLLVLGKYVPSDSKFKRAIIHLTEMGFQIYQLPDMTSEIKDMLIWDQMKFN